MSDAKHTKGPWRLGEGGLPSKLNIWAAAAWQVAKVCRFTAADDAKQATHDAESEANARLIAAAPELLEACRIVMDVAGTDWSRLVKSGGRLGVFLNNAELTTILAAIKKAEGK